MCRVTVVERYNEMGSRQGCAIMVNLYHVNRDLCHDYHDNYI